MVRARHREEQPQGREVIDFDEALFNACPPEERADLLTEARIVAHAFAATGTADELALMAETLMDGARDAQMERAHARKLAAALKRLASDPWA